MATCRKKKNKVWMWRVPSSLEGARMIRLLVAINVTSLKPFAIRIRSENEWLGNHTENKSMAGPCIIIQRALKRIRQPQNCCFASRRANSYSFYIIAFRHRHSFNSLPAMRKIVIIGRIRDNNTYVLCITVRESSRLRRARMTLKYFAVTFAFK